MAPFFRRRLQAIEEALQEKEHSLEALKMTMEHRKQFMNYIFHEVQPNISSGYDHLLAWLCRTRYGRVTPDKRQFVTCEWVFCAVFRFCQTLFNAAAAVGCCEFYSKHKHFFHKKPLAPFSINNRRFLFGTYQRVVALDIPFRVQVSLWCPCHMRVRVWVYGRLPL